MFLPFQVYQSTVRVCVCFFYFYFWKISTYLLSKLPQEHSLSISGNVIILIIDGQQLRANLSLDVDRRRLCTFRTMAGYI